MLSWIALDTLLKTDLLKTLLEWQNRNDIYLAFSM